MRRVGLRPRRTGGQERSGAAPNGDTTPVPEMTMRGEGRMRALYYAALELIPADVSCLLAAVVTPEDHGRRVVRRVTRGRRQDVFRALRRGGHVGRTAAPAAVLERRAVQCVRPPP